MSLDVVDLLGRLALATVLGALVGLEREAHAQPAGFRTHTLVALGACLFTVVGAYGFDDAGTAGGAGGGDPARIAAQVVSGIGFIGGGAILRQGATVRGLTTAATLWFAAAIGLACGAGAEVTAVAGVLIALVVLTVLRVVASRWLRPPLRTVIVDYERGHGTMGPVLAELERVAGQVRTVRVDDGDERGVPLRRVVVEVETTDDGGLDEVVARLRAMGEVRAARWTTGTR